VTFAAVPIGASAADPVQVTTFGGSIRSVPARRHGWNAARQDRPGAAARGAPWNTTSAPAVPIAASAAEPEQVTAGAGWTRCPAAFRHGWNWRRQEGPGAAGDAATVNTGQIPETAIGASEADPAAAITGAGWIRAPAARLQGWYRRRQDGPGCAAAGGSSDEVPALPATASGARAAEPLAVTTGGGWLRSPAARLHGW
jgi:hypothetical protein